MSRIGKAPVAIPSGVTVVVDASVIKVKGPKGEMHVTCIIIHNDIMMHMI